MSNTCQCGAKIARAHQGTSGQHPKRCHVCREEAKRASWRASKRARVARLRQAGELPQDRRRKLKAADIPVIRAMAAGGKPRSSIASEYNVSYNTICVIVRGEVWKGEDHA